MCVQLYTLVALISVKRVVGKYEYLTQLDDMGKRNNLLPSRVRPTIIGRPVQNLVTVLITIETECADTIRRFDLEINMEFNVFYKYCGELQCKISLVGLFF